MAIRGHCGSCQHEYLHIALYLSDAARVIALKSAALPSGTGKDASTISQVQKHSDQTSVFIQYDYHGVLMFYHAALLDICYSREVGPCY